MTAGGYYGWNDNNMCPLCPKNQIVKAASNIFTAAGLAGDRWGSTGVGNYTNQGPLALYLALNLYYTAV